APEIEKPNTFLESYQFAATLALDEENDSDNDQFSTIKPPVGFGRGRSTLLLDDDDEDHVKNNDEFDSERTDSNVKINQKSEPMVEMPIFDTNVSGPLTFPAIKPKIAQPKPGTLQYFLAKKSLKQTVPEPTFSKGQQLDNEEATSPEKAHDLLIENAQSDEDDNASDNADNADEEENDGNDGDTDRAMDEETDDESHVEETVDSLMMLPETVSMPENEVRNMHDVLMDAAAHVPAAIAAVAVKVPKIKSLFVEEEAAEEEDEFFGLGGVDGEDNDDDTQLVCSGDEDHVEDFTDIMELHRKQILDEDSKLVEEMINDVTTGNLRKKARRNHFGKGFTLSDSDDEEALLRHLKRAGARKFARNSDFDSGNHLERFVSDPKTTAFAKCFNTFNSSEDENGMISSSENEEGASFAAIKAQLAKNLSLNLTRTSSTTSSLSMKLTESILSTHGPEPLRSFSRKNSSLRMGSATGESSDVDVVVRKKPRRILKLSTTFESEPENELTSKKILKNAIACNESKNDPGDPIFEEKTKINTIDFGNFDVSKLIRRKNVAHTTKRANDHEVQALKYTSRSVIGAGRRTGVIGLHAKAALSTAFIVGRNKWEKSPTSIQKLKSEVIASNSGVAWNRASAGGLDSRELSFNSRNGSNSAGGGTGFLVGEAARRRKEEVIATSSVKKSHFSNEKLAKTESVTGSTGSGSLFNVLARSNSPF
ncbi:hypothetical protein HK100_006598, partial [Physocladia obscura]